MATYTWSIPAGKEITGSTYLKDTDNYLGDTINDLVDFVNGKGLHENQGMTYDFVDKASDQTITGVKRFTQPIEADIVFSSPKTIGGVTFDGSTDINLAGVNIAGSQDTSGNAATATKLSTNLTNYNTITNGNVVGQLAWSNYGNGHTVFDASSGLSPNNTIVSKENSSAVWSSGSPILMGWNGTSTYGLKVDTARYAASATYADSAALANVSNNAIGYNQTWQSVGRADGVTYTNTTGRPIMIAVTITGTNAGVQLYISGLLIAQNDTDGFSDGMSVSAIIPSGATYRYNSNGGTGSYIAELR